MAREELIASAVQFLQDPSVSTSPREKKIAFLESKNLTKEEVDTAFARSQEPSTTNFQNTAHNSYQLPPRQAPGYGSAYGYGPYPPGPYGQPPPPPPGRDWRDWFIMATVTTGVGYGLYTAAKRYVMPLIAPPTPPQIEQDKAAIDEEFNKAFALIDQIAADTAALKASEAERTEKLDKMLKEVENVTAELKEGNTKREAEIKNAVDQIQEFKKMVPTALEGWKAKGDSRLDELSQEMTSLKKLLESRVGRSGGSQPSYGKNTSQPVNGVDSQPRDETKGQTSNSSLATDTSSPANGASSLQSEAPATATKNSFGGERKAAIPAWQMAAANKRAET